MGPFFNEAGIPGFDLSTASYRSPYVTLLNGLTPKGTAPRMHLSQEMKALYKRYYAPPTSYENFGCCLITWVGQYVRPGFGLSPGDLEDPTGKVLSFTAVQTALERGYQPHYQSYVYDIDADTNVLTALICHADGNKPKGVCGRAVIEKLLKHVK